MTDHTTPRPWVLLAGRTFSTIDGHFHLTYEQDQYGNPFFKNFCALDDNAALIVSAVNAHAALVAALQGAHNSLRTFRNVPQKDQQWTCYDDEVMDAIDAALTLAEEKE